MTAILFDATAGINLTPASFGHGIDLPAPTAAPTVTPAQPRCNGAGFHRDRQTGKLIDMVGAEGRAWWDAECRRLDDEAEAREEALIECAREDWLREEAARQDEEYEARHVFGWLR